jgi:hypothetical protein
MNKKGTIFVLMVIMIVIVAGCAPGTSTQINVPGVAIKISTPGSNPLVNTADASGKPAGALPGIWHGIISPVTLGLSFINPDIQMYEVHNDGSQYNLGFLFGVALVFVLLGAILGARR